MTREQQETFTLHNADVQMQICIFIGILHCIYGNVKYSTVQFREEYTLIVLGYL